MLRRRRLILPTLFLLTGIATLAGCFYIPWPKSPTDPQQVDPTNVLGQRGSNRPLQVGSVTRAGVIQVLGRPRRESADGRSIAYVIERKGGVWVFPLCFFADREQSMLGVRLDFDERGILVYYQFVEERYEGPLIHDFLERIDGAPPIPPRPLPPPLDRSPQHFDGARYETVPPR